MLAGAAASASVRGQAPAVTAATEEHPGRYSATDISLGQKVYGTICVACHGPNGNAIGNVTSGTLSPVLGIGIGLGYVTTPNASPDTEIFIDVRGRALKAKVSKLPLI